MRSHSKELGFLILSIFTVGLQYVSTAHASNCDPPPSGIVAWWQAEGNALDSISGSNGAVEPGVTFTNGMVGQCFSFDGVSGCVLNDNTPSLTNIQNSFTIEFWAYPKGELIFYPPTPNDLNNGGGLQLAVFPEFGGSDGQAGVGIGVGTNGISVIEHAYNYLPTLLNYTNSLNGWVHVALVYSNKQPSLYVNGAYVATGITSPRTFVYPSKDFGGQITSPWSTYGPYKGLLDEISIYDRDLSAGEIAAIYNAGSAGKCVTFTPPTITAQPASQTDDVGTTATFSVTASGTPPLSYQWSFNGANINSATNATLVLTNVQFSQAGNYSVLVSNVAGSTNSSIAVLTVYASPPYVTAQPVNQTSVAGATVTFSVTATGTAPLSYQWSFDGTNIVGATGATLNLTDVGPVQAGDYSVFISNSYGSTNSSVAMLTVNSAPPCDPVPSGIAGWWQAEGNALDSISGSNGVVEPGTTFTNGMVGQCFSFDGVTGCVLNDNTPSLTNIQNSFTIEFWAYPKGELVFYPPTPNDLNNGGGLQLAVFPEFGGSGGQAGVGIGVGTNGISVIEHAYNYLPTLLNYTNSLNGWVHVALVYSNKQPSLYVNGVYVATGLTSPRTFVYPSKDFGGQITSPWNTYGPYKGLLDEISIYDRDLSAGEIAAIYNAGSAGKCTTPPPETVLSLGSTNAMSGSTIVVPVWMNALGVENAVLASVGYDPTKLALQSITGTNLTPVYTQTNNGYVGFAVVLNPGATFPAGSNEVADLIFTTLPVTNHVTVNLTFGDIPTGRQVVDNNFDSLPATYVGGTMTLSPAEYEADVYPRPNGDSQVNIFDWIEEGRMVAGLDVPTNSDEFARADCAPRNRPDGKLTVADWVQAGRYALGLDPLTPVPPAGSHTVTKAKPQDGPISSRILTVASVLAQRGQTVNVPVLLVCTTNENAVGATIGYNTNLSRFVSATLGANATSGRLNVNTKRLGEVGLALALSPGAAFTPGTNQVAVLQFATSTSASGTASLTLDNTVVQLEVADNTANSLSTAYVNGAIALPNQPALGVTGASGNLLFNWPLSSGTFQVQEADSPTGPWTTIMLPLITNGANVTATCAPTNHQQFFRLEGQ